MTDDEIPGCPICGASSNAGLAGRMGLYVPFQDWKCGSYIQNEGEELQQGPRCEDYGGIPRRQRRVASLVKEAQRIIVQCLDRPKDGNRNVVYLECVLKRINQTVRSSDDILCEQCRFGMLSPSMPCSVCQWKVGDAVIDGWWAKKRAADEASLAETMALHEKYVSERDQEATKGDK